MILSKVMAQTLWNFGCKKKNVQESQLSNMIIAQQSTETREVQAGLGGGMLRGLNQCRISR